MVPSLTCPWQRTERPEATGVAVKNYARVIEINNALKELGQLKETVGSYNQAIQIRPDCAETHWNLSLVLLPW